MSATDARRPATRDGLARRLARRQQGRARAPLRRVGGQRADARVRRRRRRDGPGRARPRALDLPGAQGARRRGRRATARRRPPRCALLDDELPDWTAFIAANLLVDGVLTTFVAACVDSSLDADGPARAQDPPGGGLAPRARRGVGAAAVPRGGGSATRSSRACARPGSTPAAGPAPTTTPASARRVEPGMVAPRRRPQQREQRARLAGRAARRRGRDDRARRAGRLVALGPRAAPLRAVSAADLPVLRRAATSSASASGAGRSSPRSGAAARAARTSRRCARTSRRACRLTVRRSRASSAW